MMGINRFFLYFYLSILITESRAMADKNFDETTAGIGYVVVIGLLITIFLILLTQ
ncbi:MAG: hypothetical protein R2799_08425 [Crocinitomicaceae bacterium]